MKEKETNCFLTKPPKLRENTAGSDSATKISSENQKSKFCTDLRQQTHNIENSLSPLYPLQHLTGDRNNIWWVFLFKVGGLTGWKMPVVYCSGVALGLRGIPFGTIAGTIYLLWWRKLDRLSDWIAALISWDRSATTWFGRERTPHSCRPHRAGSRPFPRISWALTRLLDSGRALCCSGPSTKIPASPQTVSAHPFSLAGPPSSGFVLDFPCHSDCSRIRGCMFLLLAFNCFFFSNSFC